MALAGTIALAVAMGIGRFAFTPLLPMMLADGVVDLHGASWLASANYLGYLIGALLCTSQPWLWARIPGLPPVEGPRLVQTGLIATGLLTLGMAVPWPAAWPALRFAAGVASSLVFIYGSAWCLARLARQGAPALGALMFVGPGAGIVASGLLASAMVAAHWRASTGWLVFGVLACGLGAAVLRTFSRGKVLAVGAGRESVPAVAGGASEGGIGTAGPITAATRGTVAAHGTVVAHGVDVAHGTVVTHGTVEVGLLAFAYGLAGLGYIVTATFLPVIAREALPGSAWLDLFWPIFGAGVIVGALVSSRMRPGGDMRLLIAGAYVIQAAGIGASLVSPSLAGFVIGSLLLGLPFTALTFFAIQEVRRMRPHSAAGTTGLLTVVWSLGQLAGPPMASWLVHRAGSAALGFTWSLEVAASVLLSGAVLWVALTRIYPMARGFGGARAAAPGGGREGARGRVGR